MKNTALLLIAIFPVVALTVGCGGNDGEEAPPEVPAPGQPSAPEQPQPSAPITLVDASATVPIGQLAWFHFKNSKPGKIIAIAYGTDVTNGGPGVVEVVVGTKGAFGPPFGGSTIGEAAGQTPVVVTGTVTSAMVASEHDFACYVANKWSADLIVGVSITLTPD